jgi:transketolase
MRRAFSDCLVEIADIDEKLVFPTGDLGYQVFTELEEKHPDKYINAGIAEAQLATCAAGLALSGFKPIIYSIASFITGRAFEQIRVSINYQQLPVLIVGAGGGYIYSNSGVTHHAAEDLGLMSLMPGMQIFNPGSPKEVRSLLKQFLETEKPGYMRVGRFGEPEYEALDDIFLGKLRTVKQGNNIAILSTGDAVIDCVKACELLEDDGICLSHYQFHTLSPFDEDGLENIFDSYEHLVVVEEHFPQGALYSKVCELKVAKNFISRVYRLGPENVLQLGAPSLDSLRADNFYDALSITHFCRNLFNKCVNNL